MVWLKHQMYSWNLVSSLSWIFTYCLRTEEAWFKTFTQHHWYNRKGQRKIKHLHTIIMHNMKYVFFSSVPHYVNSWQGKEHVEQKVVMSEGIYSMNSCCLKCFCFTTCHTFKIQFLFPDGKIVHCSGIHWPQKDGMWQSLCGTISKQRRFTMTQRGGPWKVGCTLYKSVQQKHWRASRIQTWRDTNWRLNSAQVWCY